MSEERYEIIKLLGKGRTGGVYEAEDTRLGRKVAMRRFFTLTEVTDVTEYKKDFIEISHSLSALQHPNLLRVYDAGVDDDGAFIVSQLLQGDTLHNRLKEGPLPTWDVWDMGHQMLDALSTAHSEGFIHGAITPGSILMTPRARGGYLYVILDMGLCKLAPLIQEKDSVLSMMADPAILAPELFDESVADEKSDLYMLGNIIYMCLAGGHPFANKSIEECGELHKRGLPPVTDYASDDVPEDFIAWMDQLCQIDPNDRPASVVEALQTMPKVQKPAKAPQISPTNIENVGGTTAPLSTVPASTIGNHAANPLATGPLTTIPANTTGPLTAIPTNTTGPLTAGPLTAGPATTLGGVTTGAMTNTQTVNTFQQPKKSKKGLFIILAVVVLLGVIIAIMAGGGDSKPQNKSPNGKPKQRSMKDIEEFNRRMREQQSQNKDSSYNAPDLTKPYQGEAVKNSLAVRSSKPLV